MDLVSLEFIAVIFIPSSLGDMKGSTLGPPLPDGCVISIPGVFTCHSPSRRSGDFQSARLEIS